jgi:predicted peroxiredoxin
MMKMLSFLAGLLIIAVSCVNVSNHDEKSLEKDGVFIHITESYGDAHRVLMPLKMAVMMAEDKDVIVYLDIHAVEFLVKGAEDISLEGFESAHTYIQSLVDKNVGVFACPACMQVAGLDPATLMEGVQTAQKDKFFDFTKGRIITLDY